MLSTKDSEAMAQSRPPFQIDKQFSRAGFAYEAMVDERPNFGYNSMIFSPITGLAIPATSTSPLGGSIANSRSGSFMMPPNTNNTNINTVLGANASTLLSHSASTFLGSNANLLELGASGPGSGQQQQQQQQQQELFSVGKSVLPSSSIATLTTAISSSSPGYAPSFHNHTPQKKYSATIRSGASSFLGMGKGRSGNSSNNEPLCSMLTHQPSPYESIFCGPRPDVAHFICKDLRMGTVCISIRPAKGETQFLVRTPLRFVNVQVADAFRITPAFDACRSLYPKGDDRQGLLHFALQQCLMSIPEGQVQDYQEVRQNGGDHSTFFLNEPGWMHTSQNIHRIVTNLEEIKHDGFGLVLKNLEAQMRPAALTVDLVIPNPDILAPEESTRFRTFFDTLGDHVEIEPMLVKEPKKLETLVFPMGTKNEEYRQDAVMELIETERNFGIRMKSISEVYLREAKAASAAATAASAALLLNGGGGGGTGSLAGVGPGTATSATGTAIGTALGGAGSVIPPLGKYEMKLLFNNIDQIVAVSEDFLADLEQYLEYTQNPMAAEETAATATAAGNDVTSAETMTKDAKAKGSRPGTPTKGSKGAAPADKCTNLGEICYRHMRAMQPVYRAYLFGYSKSAQTFARQSRKSVHFGRYLEKCREITKGPSLSDLLVEPTQRIPKYPLLIKEILAGTALNQQIESRQLCEAATLAAEVSHMQDGKLEQTATLLLRIHRKIEGCPDSLVNGTRSVHGYLDGHETNLLSGEKGKPLTMVLFADKVMIVKRPRGVNGESLFQDQEAIAAAAAAAAATAAAALGNSGGGGGFLSGKISLGGGGKKDILFGKEGGSFIGRDPATVAAAAAQAQAAANAAAAAQTAAAAVASSALSLMGKREWRFIAWMDLKQLELACLDQTDPEGLFAVFTKNHRDSKKDPWETIQGFQPESVQKRDEFISKFYSALTLAKAKAVAGGGGSGNTSPGSGSGDGIDTRFKDTCRLHVAELEVFCNVYTEAQYLDLKFKSEISMFYLAPGTAMPDLTRFGQLSQCAGVIQAGSGASDGFRSMLRSKISLQDYATQQQQQSLQQHQRHHHHHHHLPTNKVAIEDEEFLEMDSFQIHLTELWANLQWTIFRFSPYESAQLHYSKHYTGTTDYLFKTAQSFQKTTSVFGMVSSGPSSGRGMKKIQPIYYSSSSANLLSSPSGLMYPMNTHNNGSTVATAVNGGGLGGGGGNIGNGSRMLPPTGNSVGGSMHFGNQPFSNDDTLINTGTSTATGGGGGPGIVRKGSHNRGNKRNDNYGPGMTIEEHNEYHYGIGGGYGTQPAPQKAFSSFRQNLTNFIPGGRKKGANGFAM